MDDKDYQVECYEQLHKLAMSDEPSEAVAGRFCKEFMQRFDDFEQSEADRQTPPGALALGEVHAAMLLVCAKAFSLAKKGREEMVAQHIREIVEKVIRWHVEIAKQR